MWNQELDSNQHGKCVKFKIISSKNKSLIYFHEVQDHWLKHSLSCFLCSSSTLSSNFRSKNKRRAWLLYLYLYLYLYLIESVNDTILSVRPDTATRLQREQCWLLPRKKLLGLLSSWPARCWILISGVSLAKALQNKCL